MFKLNLLNYLFLDNLMIKISLFYFIISLFFGIMILYIIQPDPKIIIKYPTIDSLDKNVYKDDQGTCYSYKKEEVDC